MTLYEKLKQAGCEIDHHESDLYVKVTEPATKIIREHNQAKGWKMPQTFRCAIDKTTWYDIPFMFDPFWDSKKLVK